MTYQKCRAGAESGDTGAGTTVITVAGVASGRLRFSQVSLEKSTRDAWQERKSGHWGWSHGRECSRSRIPLLPPLPYLFFNPHPLKINQLCPVHSSGHPPACAVSDPSVLTDFQNHVIHPAKHAVDLWSTHLLRSTVLPDGSGRCVCACGVGGSVSSGYQKRGCVQTGVPATSLIPCSDDYRKCVSEFRWQNRCAFPPGQPGGWQTPQSGVFR